MSYVIVPVLLSLVFVGYLMYLLLIKKDRKNFKAVVFPGLFFIAVWILFYMFLLK
ncbi:hypothetical protein [Chryseobacterium sp. MFBS3-17]|uniref:hypothetical protein n=1 Tax=Chryseobacterium sp. MFBS3-17 TaxID=2886689 RepID=UPI001D0E960C|nr:hypothetical protein [Chryseobacterium sp. MFBS3-17]MCC2590248.1 hypothetical protein [Chryseobacterium sp. MFBS3-17]